MKKIWSMINESEKPLVKTAIAFWLMIQLGLSYGHCFAANTVTRDGKTFTVTATRSQRETKPGRETGYSINLEKKRHITVDGVKYEYQGVYQIMQGSKGGYYIVVGKTPEGKEVKVYNAIPEEVKQAIKNND